MKTDFSKYLLLEPYEFDQGDKGWRGLDENGKFLEAAQVIEAYLDRNKKRSKNTQKKTPSWEVFWYSMPVSSMRPLAHNIIKKLYRS